MDDTLQSEFQDPRDILQETKPDQSSQANNFWQIQTETSIGRKLAKQSRKSKTNRNKNGLRIH